jgi:hypothetical protein
MDKYLKFDSAYDRLWAEYQKYGSLIVAVDFDDTIFDFHGTGESYEQVRQLVRDLHKANCFIAIWTGNQNTEFIETFLAENDIPHNSINDEAPVSKKMLGDKIPRKLYANVYLDDRAGLNHVYNDLRRLLVNIEPKPKTFYRVCNENTGQGLWYGFKGDFTGLIHGEFSFCKNFNLDMDFDPELVGWLSATDSLEDLYKWFPEEDIEKLQKHGWYLYEYKAEDYKFYDKFQHYVINQNTSVKVRKRIRK